MIRFYLFLFLIFFIFSIKAQEPSIPFFQNITWGIKYGLNVPNVNTFTEDRNGIIWVGTTEGIYRHDSHKLTNLQEILADDAYDINLNIQDLYVDKYNTLWIGTYSSGLFSYDIDDQQFTQIKAKINPFTDISNMRVYGINLIQDSIIRFTSHNNGLITYNIKNKKTELLKSVKDTTWINEINGFQLMYNYVLNENNEREINWLRTLAGLVEYNEKKDTFIYYNPPNDSALGVRAAIIHKNNIWCATYSEGIYNFNIKTKKWKNYRCAEGPDNFNNCLNAQALNFYKNYILISTESEGLYILDTLTESIFSYREIYPNNKLPDNISQISWFGKKLWASSYNNGISIINPLDYIKQTNHLSSRISSMAQHKNCFYISSYGSQEIQIICNQKHESIKIPTNIQDNKYIFDITFDNNERLWIATPTNLLYYDISSKTFSNSLLKYSPDNLKTHIDIRKLLYDPNNKIIWASSQDGTVLAIDEQTLKIKYYGNKESYMEPLPYNYSVMVKSATKDKKVFFESQDGVFFYDGIKHTFSKISAILEKDKNIFTTLNNTTITTTEEGNLIFGVNLDKIYLINIKNNSLNNIPSNPELPPYKIKKIICDSSNIIWATTMHGVAKINVNTNESEFFSIEEGVEKVNDIKTLNHNELLFVCDYDYYIIRPNEIQNQNHKPSIIIKSYQVGSKPEIKKNISSANSIHIKLGPKDQFLRITYDDVSYFDQTRKKYRIKLNLLHKEWIYMGERQEITLNNIQSGNHDIWIQSKLKNDLSWSDPVKLCSLSVTPIYYKKYSFWFIIILLSSVFIYLIYKYRINKLRERQELIIAFNKQIAETEMKALRAQMNPHFLFNVLNAIKLNVQKNKQEDAILFITDFSKLIRSVLQNSSKKSIPLKDELEAVELYIKIEKKRFANHSFEYQFNIDSKIPISSINVPPMLIQPYVENAIWHGILHKNVKDGKIVISLVEEMNKIIISIEDNGIGRTQANQLKLKSANPNKSMGLQITQDRMDLNNRFSEQNYHVNIIDIVNNKNEALGTKVEITITEKYNHKNYSNLK